MILSIGISVLNIRTDSRTDGRTEGRPDATAPAANRSLHSKPAHTYICTCAWAVHYALLMCVRVQHHLRLLLGYLSLSLLHFLGLRRRRLVGGGRRALRRLCAHTLVCTFTLHIRTCRRVHACRRVCACLQTCGRPRPPCMTQVRCFAFSQ